jgi:uncharacterized protein YkwD
MIMPFSRSRTIRDAASSLLLAVALLAMGQAGARAEGAEAAGAGTATPVAQPATLDLRLFCPVPTGRWWEDYSALGCAERMSGRDATTLTADELSWLNLGDLPAYATVDIAAVDAALATFAAEHEAREAAAREAAERANARPAPAPARPATTTRVRQPIPTFEQLEQMLAECGIGRDYVGAVGEHPCVAAAWARIVAEMPVFEVPTGPGIPALRTDWHDVMLAAVNDARSSRGVRPVAACPSLTRSAQAYAEVLRDWRTLAHIGPDGSDPFDRAVRDGYGIRIEISPGVYMVDGLVGENVAGGHASVPEAMYGWMNSPGHRSNLLNGKWAEAGFGLARADSRSDRFGYYWVQLFGDGTGNC